jgi:hypothetical protein
MQLDGLVDCCSDCLGTNPINIATSSEQCL